MSVLLWVLVYLSGITGIVAISGFLLGRAEKICTSSHTQKWPDGCSGGFSCQVRHAFSGLWFAVPLLAPVLFVRWAFMLGLREKVVEPLPESPREKLKTEGPFR